MIQKRVRNAAIGVGITVGILAALTILFRKTNAGKYVTDSLRGFGQNVGLGITAPFTGIVEGVTTGAGALGEAAKAASEGFQKSVSETLGGGFNVFSEFGKLVGAEQQPPKQTTQSQPKQDTRPQNTGSAQARPTAPTNTGFDLSLYLSNQASQARIAASKARAELRPKEAFGGFASAEKQEAALKKALEDAKRKYPQYYTASTVRK